MRKLIRRLDLQAKIFIVLVAVVVPTFVIVTVAENQFTRPIIEDEIRQVGINTGKTLAAEIDSSRLLAQANPTPAIEGRIQEVLYSQPSISRIDVFAKDIVTGLNRIVATNVEDDPAAPTPAPAVLIDSVTSEYRTDEFGVGYWDINVPIEHRARDVRGPKRILGAVHVIVSTKLVERIVVALWRTTATAASFSVVALILGLSYFLRKTVNNDRKLRQAETQNVQLTSQLHEAERQVMNTEKLAVMGQLTASFAHEIGTPLNAIGGHLQLLKEDLSSAEKPQSIADRLSIINGQVSKIESIVKSFLQSTAKPTSQTQLVDINQLTDKTLGIVRPRIDALGVEIRRDFDRNLGPIRIVPLELEQILLNVVNNSLDSLKGKRELRERSRLALEVTTAETEANGKKWAQISVYDTGEGIKKSDMSKVLKPFFTTKPPGEGTGLGLTICQQIAHKYGGVLEIDSREGAWTRVNLKLPYEMKV